MHGLLASVSQAHRGITSSLTHGLVQPSQLHPRHTWFRYSALAMVQAQKPASWNLLRHASLLACSLCARESPHTRCECTCLQWRLGRIPCDHEPGVCTTSALEYVDTVKGHLRGVCEEKVTRWAAQPCSGNFAIVYQSSPCFPVASPMAPHTVPVLGTSRPSQWPPGPANFSHHTPQLG